VEQISIERIRSFRGGINVDVVLGSVGEQIDTSLELLKELRISPWCDGLNCRIKSNCAHFKSDLIVSFARRAVRHIFSTFSLGDSDLRLRDQRTRNRGSEKISALVNGVAFHSGEYEI
jgi:hypothetical protein